MSVALSFGSRCPQCGTLFRVHPVDAEVAYGWCRCGVCDHSFDVHDQAESLPPALYAPRVEEPVAATSSPHGSEPFPVTAPDRGARRWLWRLAVGALVLVLVGELIWFNRQELLAEPVVRQWAGVACARLGCQLPLPRRPAAVKVTERALTAASDGRLRFSAQLVNTADTSIGWPVLHLHLTGTNDREVAAHRFVPRDYLSQSPSPQGMPRAQPVSVDVRVPEPTPRAEGFRLVIR